MKKLLIIAFILLIAAPAWGATIYVKDDPNNSGTKVCFKSGGWADGTCSDGTGNTNLTAAHTAAGLGGTLVVAAGTYAGTQLGATGIFVTGAAGVTVRAASSGLDSGSTGWSAGYSGTVTINGNGASNHTIRINHAGAILSALTISMPANTYNAVDVMLNASNPILNDIAFVLGNGGVSANAIGATNITAATTITVNRAVFNGCRPLFGGDSDVTPTINYSKFISTIANPYNQGAIFNNDIFVGNAVGPVFNTSANTGASVTWNNPIFYGNATSSGAYHILNKANDQTWIINNGILADHPTNADTYNYNGVTINTSSYRNLDPKFVSNKYPAILSFASDDDANLDWFYGTVAPLLEAHGMRGTIAMAHTRSLSVDQITKLTTLENAGHEIAVHTRDHVNMATLTAPFTIAKAATTSGLTGGVLSTSTPHSYTLSDYTMTQLRTQMAADGYTCGTVQGGWEAAPATLLADFAAGTSIATAYNLAVDEARARVEEIDNCWQDLTNAGLHPTSFVCPYDATSAALQAYLLASGKFTAARGGVNSSAVLSSINVFSLPDMPNTTFTDYDTCDNTETQANCIKRQAIARISKMAFTGEVRVFLAHNEAEFNADQWTALLDAVQQSGIPVKTLSQLGSYATTYDPSSDLATADSMTYTRTLIDQSDYHLQSGSPAINAGVNVCTAEGVPFAGCTGAGTGTYTDYEGKIVPQGSAPDIGAYEYPILRHIDYYRRMN